MKSIDQYKMYELGGRLQHLKDVASNRGANTLDQAVALFTAEEAISELLSGELLEITFCRDAALALVEQIGRCLGPLKGNLDKRDPLETWELRPVTHCIDVFEHQLNAEMKRIAAYAVPKRGIFDTERLVGTAEVSIPEQLRQAMPDMAATEFRASGRCLAFGLYSASGFHAMRAVETVLRQYHKSFAADGTKSRTMGEMAGELEGRVNNGKGGGVPCPEVVRLLKDVTKFDRNPLMHPNVVLSEMDALLLFNRAHALLVVMAQELEKLRSPGLKKVTSKKDAKSGSEDTASTALLSGKDLQPKAVAVEEK